MILHCEQQCVGQCILNASDHHNTHSGSPTFTRPLVHLQLSQTTSVEQPREKKLLKTNSNHNTTPRKASNMAADNGRSKQGGEERTPLSREEYERRFAEDKLNYLRFSTITSSTSVPWSEAQMDEMYGMYRKSQPAPPEVIPTQQMNSTALVTARQSGVSRGQLTK